MIWLKVGIGRSLWVQLFSELFDSFLRHIAVKEAPHRTCHGFQGESCRHVRPQLPSLQKSKPYLRKDDHVSKMLSGCIVEDGKLASLDILR